jgi:hypothetical protein
MGTVLTLLVYISAYSLEVYDPEKPQEALAKFALNPYPIHHPEGRDMALIHLKQEEEGEHIWRIT